MAWLLLYNKNIIIKALFFIWWASWHPNDQRWLPLNNSPYKINLQDFKHKTAIVNMLEPATLWVQQWAPSYCAMELPS